MVDDHTRTSRYDPEKTKQFICRAISVHGDDRFDYTKTRLRSLADKVMVKCKRPGHPEFAIVAQNHIKKGRPGGCPTCWRDQNIGGAKPIEFEGRLYKTAKQLAEAHGIESNALVAFLKRVPNFKIASEKEIRTALDKVYVPRDLKIEWRGTKYDNFKGFYTDAKNETKASYNSLRRWIIHEGIDIETAIKMTPSVSSGKGNIYLVEHSDSGKKYVGQTRIGIIRRWQHHVRSALIKNSNAPLHEAIRRHGANSFEMALPDLPWYGPYIVVTDQS